MTLACHVKNEPQISIYELINSTGMEKSTLRLESKLRVEYCIVGLHLSVQRINCVKI